MDAYSHRYTYFLNQVRMSIPLSSRKQLFRAFHDVVCITGPLYGEFTGPSEFPAQRPVTQNFNVFFDLRLK